MSKRSKRKARKGHQTRVQPTPPPGLVPPRSQSDSASQGQGCKLTILSPRGTSGERTEERGNQQERAPSPNPSTPSDGREGEIKELDAGLAQGRRHEAWLEFWVGVAIMLLITAVKVWLEHTSPGHWMASQTYEWLHGHLAARTSETNLPLVLVDISDLKPQRLTNVPAITNLEFTSRGELQDLIEKIATARMVTNTSPLAIGVDVDLSPEVEGFVAPGSFRLFDTCLKLATNTSPPALPVFLGVRRMEAFGPAAWLGHRKYQRLAASISRPKERVVKRMPREYRFNSNSNWWLKSLSYAIADSGREKPGVGNLEDQHSLRHILTEEIKTTPQDEVSDFEIHDFLVDYSQQTNFANQIVKRSDLIRWDTNELANRLQGKIVLIGDAATSEVTDSAVLPGEIVPVSGIYLHACAVYSLVRAPLRELTWWAALAMVLVLSTASLLVILWACLKRSAHGSFSPILLHLVLTLLFMVLYLAFAVQLLKHRVLFLDVVTVCVVMIAHLLVDIFKGSVNLTKLKESRGNLDKVAEALVTPQHAEEKT